MQCRVKVASFFRGGGVGEAVVGGGGGGAAFQIFCMEHYACFFSFFLSLMCFLLFMSVYLFLFSYYFHFHIFFYASRCLDIIMILPLFLSFFPFLFV